MWSSSFLWLSGSPHYTWDMIDCSGDDSVRGISMDSNNLIGTLPLEIFSNLKNVETVNFGSLPAEIGNMPRLEYLNVEENSQLLSGTIPTALINAPLLSYFDVTGCAISGSIPTEVGLFTSLTFLDVSKRASVGGLPTELENPIQLQTLSVWGTKMTGTAPSDLSRLSNLSRILFYDTDPTGGLENLFCDRSGTPDFTFWSDCDGFIHSNRPELVCNCCSRCCNPIGSDCEEVAA